MEYGGFDVMLYNFNEYLELWQLYNEDRHQSVKDFYQDLESVHGRIYARQQLTKLWFMIKGDKDVDEALRYDSLPITEHDIDFIWNNSNVSSRGVSKDDMIKCLGGSNTALKTMFDIGYYDLTKDKIYLTGFKRLDKLTNGLGYGSLTIFTGDSGSGKSTLLNQMFIAEAIKQGESVFLFSGELTEKNINQWLLETMANSDDFEMKMHPVTQSEVRQVKRDAQQNIMLHVGDKIDIFTDFSNCKLSNILAQMRLSRSRGKKIFILDNLMMIDYDMSDFNRTQGRIASELKNFAKEHDAIVILVAHIRKTSDDKITKDSVSGSKEITNLADYVFALTRNEDSTHFEDGMPSSKLTLLKNRRGGDVGKSLFLDFNRDRKRFCEMINNKTDRFMLMKEYYKKSH